MRLRRVFDILIGVWLLFVLAAYAGLIHVGGFVAVDVVDGGAFSADFGSVEDVIEAYLLAVAKAQQRVRDEGADAQRAGSAGPSPAAVQRARP